MTNITVDELARELMKASAKGMGDYSIVISDDNEGNGFHGCFFGVTPASSDFDSDIRDSNHEGHNYVIIG